MLLRKIVLSNIRSYAQQTIELAEGSTLLAGDIGCGKSSILLAIEFALFGASRPDLPAEALLRKGQTHGSVELNFSLAGQEISIKRNLKKDKTSIKQSSGQITVNGLTKELTPVELKAEIINLLGYPEEFIEKNKNYIYRFTVYTPQEEMKSILNQEPEARLEVIRKIFNLEKYRIVRENVQLVLRQMRVSLMLFKGKLENVAEKREALNKLQAQAEEWQSRIIEQQQPLQEILRQIVLKRKTIEQMETILKQRQALVLDQARLSALIEEKRQFFISLTQKKDSLAQQLSRLGLLEGFSEEAINSEIKQLEGQEKWRVTLISTLQERLVNLRQMIDNFRQETQSLEDQLSMKEELGRQLGELQGIIQAKQELEQQLAQLEQPWELCRASIVKNKTVIAAAEELKLKLLSLSSCPTCLQEVSMAHKHNISQKEDQLIEAARAGLKPLELQQLGFLQQSEALKQKLAWIQKQEQLAAKLQAQWQQLNESVLVCAKKKEQLKQLAQENNLVAKQLQAASENPSWQEQISKLQEVKLKLSAKKILEKNQAEVDGQLAALQQLIGLSEQQLKKAVHDLGSKADPQDEIIQERNSYALLKEQEQEYSLKITELKANLANDLKNKEQLETELRQLQALELERQKLQDTYNWLELFFLPLTSAIEKQVLAQVYHNFNETFKEWFSILIDNEQISASLDDSFTPVIEQNGYEIFFSNLSGGERTAASLAYRLSLTRVINDVVARIRTKDFLILDEPTEGFSSEQLDRVRDVLERLQLRQTIIVSHASKIESFVDNVIRINKEGAESVIYR